MPHAGPTAAIHVRTPPGHSTPALAILKRAGRPLAGDDMHGSTPGCVGGGVRRADAGIPDACRAGRAIRPRQPRRGGDSQRGTLVYEPLGSLTLARPELVAHAPREILSRQVRRPARAGGVRGRDRIQPHRVVATLAVQQGRGQGDRGCRRLLGAAHPRRVHERQPGPPLPRLAQIEQGGMHRRIRGVADHLVPDEQDRGPRIRGCRGVRAQGHALACVEVPEVGPDAVHPTEQEPAERDRGGLSVSAHLADGVDGSRSSRTVTVGPSLPIIPTRRMALAWGGRHR